MYVLLAINTLFGISQYFLSRKMKVILPLLSLIPGINILNFIVLSGISIQKIILPVIFLAFSMSFGYVALSDSHYVSLGMIIFSLLFYV